MDKAEALDRLIRKGFWYNEREGGFEWSFIEGTTVAFFDEELNSFLRTTYPKHDFACA